MYQLRILLPNIKMAHINNFKMKQKQNKIKKSYKGLKNNKIKKAM